MHDWTRHRPTTFADLPILRAADARSMGWATVAVLLTFGALSKVLDVNTSHPAFADPEKQFYAFLAILVFPMFGWVNFLLWFFSAVRFETDLQQLRGDFEDEVAREHERLRVPPRELLLHWLASWAFIIMLGPYTDASTFGVEPGFRFIQVFSEGPAMIFLWWVVTPFVALMVALGAVCMLHQVAVLSRLSKSLPIRLELMQAYEPLANTLLRVFVVFSAGAAFMPGIALAGDDAKSTAAIFLTVIVLIGIPVCGLVARPVFHFRNRVQAFKQARLAELRTALAELDASAPADAAKRATLLTDYMFVESRREWPIAPQVQWVFLFGLLPPATWVMAAALENLLFG